MPVGGTAQYSVIARDASGQTVAAPAVAWSSGTPAVGTITAVGLATGLSRGQSVISASAGNVTSLPATLNVIESGACDGIAAVAQWDARVSFSYSDYVETPSGALVTVTHDARVGAALTPAGSVGGKLLWTGALYGVDYPQFQPGVNIYVREEFDDHVSDPTELMTLDGIGTPVPTPGVDGMRLEVDLATCTFQFFVTPSVHTTLTKIEHAVLVLPGPDEGTRVFTGDTPLGTLQKGVTPLGAWRAAGVGDYPDPRLIFPAYAITAIPPSLDAYVPSGEFAQSAYLAINATGPRSASFGGQTLVNYSIVVHVP